MPSSDSMYDYLYNNQYDDPCSYTCIVIPDYGESGHYINYDRDANQRYWNYNVWGWSIDSVLAAITSSGYNIIIDADPHNIAQVRWQIYRTKAWRPNGTVITNEFNNSWTIDPGVFYKDGTILIGGTYYPQPNPRINYSGWHFSVYDHPGPTDLEFHYEASGNYAEVCCSYIELAHSYYTAGSVQCAPDRHFKAKVILRQPADACYLDYNIDCAWVTSGTAIPDWPNPPSGLQFPD